MVKKGDTLIEVTLAVGIFSMIAVAIVAVMSNGTSNAQLSLETTLAREEIDTQAEALRFIHSAYLADRDSTDNQYVKLWEKITKSALKADSIEGNDDAKKHVFNFTPDNCGELYEKNLNSYNNIYMQNAFIINPRGLDSNNAIFYIGDNGDRFSATTTYPRLLFSNSSGGTEELINTSANNVLSRAEGIYVIAVKDAETTSIVNQNNTSVAADDTTKASAFYDFYIRTCWYGTDAEHPSTISTVMRLYDPDVVSPKN